MQPVTIKADTDLVTFLNAENSGKKLDPQIVSNLTDITKRLVKAGGRLIEAWIDIAKEVALAYDACQNPNAPAFGRWLEYVGIEYNLGQRLVKLGHNHFDEERRGASASEVQRLKAAEQLFKMPSDFAGMVAFMIAPEAVADAVVDGTIAPNATSIVALQRQLRNVTDDRDQIQRKLDEAIRLRAIADESAREARVNQTKAVQTARNEEAERTAKRVRELERQLENVAEAGGVQKEFRSRCDGIILAIDNFISSLPMAKADVMFRESDWTRLDEIEAHLRIAYDAINLQRTHQSVL
jgi:hypothetical protein